MDVERFILDHGAWSYLVTLVWTFFEGETFVLLAGFAAAQGLLSAPLLLLAACLGSFAGDQCYFWIGRHFGLGLMARRPDWRTRVDQALGWLKRYDIGFILSFRFIYGVRNFSSFALGISGIDWRRFLVLNLLAAFIWAGAFVGAGFVFGHEVEHMLGHVVRQASMALLAVFVLLLIGGHVLHRMRRGRKRRIAGATALVFVLTTSIQARAASPCFNAADIEADQAIRYQTELMVLSDTCGLDNYRDFTVRNSNALAAYQHQLLEHFRRAGVKSPAASLDTFLTELANELAVRSGPQLRLTLCTQSQPFLIASEKLDPDAFRKHISELAIEHEDSYRRCK
jgi:membrane protein DedA with SNARE-associated domain